VLGLLAAALEAGTDALVRHLVVECDLPGWLARAPVWVTSLPRDGDGRRARRSPAALCAASRAADAWSAQGCPGWALCAERCAGLGSARACT